MDFDRRPFLRGHGATMIHNLLAALGRRKDPTVATAAAAHGDGQKTILIIDRDPDSLRAMCLALGGETYRVETADTAGSATRKLSASHPDLILLNPQVPAADGTRLARRLLADEELASVPILALTQTVAVTGSDRKLCGRYDGTIRKPTDAGEFAGEVRGFLESSLREAPHSAAKVDLPAGVDVDPRKNATTLLDAIEAALPDSQFACGTRAGLHELAGVVEDLLHYELAEYVQQAERLSNAHTARARSRFRSVIRLCRELLEREPDPAPGLADLRVGYLDHRRAELSSLEHALTNGDFAALRKAGHNLKGMGAAYGFAELTDIGRALEAAAKDDDAASIEILLDQIDAYISIVRPSPEHRGDYDKGI